MNIAIIGSGPSALMCALNVKENNKVSIITQDEKLGKKILVTGNGRCNITNKNINKDSYNQDISKFLLKFGNDDLIDYFKNLGLECYYDNEGRFYPISNSATSVVDILSREINSKSNINCIFNTKVENIKHLDNKFVVNNNYKFDKIVVCTGSSYDILDNLNVSYNQFVPSLMALKTKQNTKRLSGQKLSNVNVTLNYNNTTKTEFGEVLFKDNGLSGICIFNLSSFLARKNNFDAKIVIDLLPSISEEKLILMLKNRLTLKVNYIYEYMQGLFHKEINKYILNCLNIDEMQKITKIDEKMIKNIAKTIKNLTFDVNSYYSNNQIYVGGVKLSDLTDSLQYKKIPGLYFCGEVCDVDGMCGGYNLQWAFTSGKIVGENL